MESDAKIVSKTEILPFLPIPNKHTCVSDTPCATPISLNESLTEIKNLLNNLQISFSFNNINNRMCEKEREWGYSYYINRQAKGQCLINEWNIQDQIVCATSL